MSNNAVLNASSSQQSQFDSIVVALHILSELEDQSHYDEVTSIVVTPDGLRYKSHLDLSPFILLSLVMMLLPVLYWLV